MNQKIIVYHPGQQHSQKVAIAVMKAGCLEKYFTSVYDKNNSIIMRLVHLIIGKKDKQRIVNRRTDELDDSVVETHYMLLSLLVILLSRMKKTKYLSVKLDRWISKKYGILVAKKAIKLKVDAVICFSMNEATCFDYLKKNAPEIRRIVDCANSPIPYMKMIYDRDMEKTDSKELKNETSSFWREEILTNYYKAINDTHYFLAPSRFVEKGLMYCGVKKEKINILPYGSNFTSISSHQPIPHCVRFIYVGRVTYRKGMHYLLKAFSELSQNGIELEVIGSWNSNSDLYKKYSQYSNIHFRGNVIHDEVRKALLQSNVFVFMSLAEGLSLSCIEALSCGLPIICSCNSGINDMIVNGENGYVIAPDDIEGIKKYVMYFYNHPEVIPIFSKKAIDTSYEYTWEKYYEGLAKSLHTILDSR